MNINPLDILLVVFLLITLYIGYKNGAIIEFKKTVSLESKGPMKILPGLIFS